MLICNNSHTGSVSKTYIHIATNIICNFYELLYHTIRISVGKKFANNISWQWAIKSHGVQTTQQYTVQVMYNHTSTVYVVYIIEWMIAKLKGILLLYNFQSTAHNSSWSLLPYYFFISLLTSCTLLQFLIVKHQRNFIFTILFIDFKKCYFSFVYIFLVNKNRSFPSKINLSAVFCLQKIYKRTKNKIF